MMVPLKRKHLLETGSVYLLRKTLELLMGKVAKQYLMNQVVVGQRHLKASF